MRRSALIPLVVIIIGACSSADPGEPMHTLTVTAVAGATGSGTVATDVIGIDCAISSAGATGTCTAQFAEGTLLGLYTSPSPGSRFLEWSGACSAGHECGVQLLSDVAVAAAFERATALAFDGVQQFAEFPDATALDLSDTWTIEAWVRPAPPGGGGIQHLVSKWGVTGAASYSLEMNGTGLSLSTSNGVDPTTTLIAADVLRIDTWQHVAATFNNGVAFLYVNGENVGGVAGMAIPMNSDKPLSLGHEGPPFNGYHFKGVLDEVRVWQVVRTTSEINDFRSAVQSPQAGLVGYWRLDDGSGQVITDRSGLGNNGRLGATTAPEASDPLWSTNNFEQQFPD